MAAKSKAKTPPKAGTTSAKNSMGNLKLAAQRYVKEAHPDTRNGFEAFQHVMEVRDRMLEKFTEQELLTVMFGLTASNPSIADFISSYDKA